MTVSLDTGPSAATIVIASGGLDSTTLIYHLQAHGSRVRLLSFDYGQLHRRELDCARQIAGILQVSHDVVDLRPVGALLSGSALTDPAVAVPDGHYTDESMRATVVPNRNALMLDVAVAVAVTAGCDAVAFGAHGGDHAIYPDCRPEFVAAFTASARLANEGFLASGFRVLAQFLAAAAGAVIRPPLAWREVPAFLAGGAVTIIPSTRETFGNLALESLSAGTPVVAYAVGNLPALLGETTSGVLAPPRMGPRGLWQAARGLLDDPVRYRQACGGAYCRSRNYRSADIADAFLKAVQSC
jgi:7-cyano-7-deazaguanine synthase